MKLDKIILELKQIEKGEKELKDLIIKLEQEYKEQNFINKPSDKKKLSAIKKVVCNKKQEGRVFYNSFSKQNGKIYITDSYQMYELNDEYLPLEYASQEKELTEEEKNIVEKYNLKIKNAVYPSTSNLFNILYCTETPYEFDVDEILKLEKTTPIENGMKLYTINTGDVNVSLNLIHLKYAIDILKLQGKATLKLYGDTRPVIIENNDGEKGLILPVKKF